LSTDLPLNYPLSRYMFLAVKVGSWYELKQMNEGDEEQWKLGLSCDFSVQLC